MNVDSRAQLIGFGLLTKNRGELNMAIKQKSRNRSLNQRPGDKERYLFLLDSS
jgi:hypothetical protein